MAIQSAIEKLFGNRLRGHATRLMLFCGLAALLCTFAALAGWAFHTDALVRVWSAWEPMELNVAFGIATATIALLLPIGTAAVWRQARTVAATFVAILALATLIEICGGINLGIDFAALHAPLQPDSAHPGRMAPNAALALILTSFLLAWIDRAKDDMQLDVLHWLGYAVIAIGVTGLIGHALKLEFLYNGSGVARMAPQTAVAIALMGIATVARLHRLRESRSESAAVNASDLLAGLSCLLIVTVAVTGLAGFSALQAHVENVMSQNTMRILRDRQIFVDTVIQSHAGQAEMTSVRPAVIKDLQRLNRDPGDETIHAALQEIGGSFLSSGFDGVEFSGRRQSFVRAGSPAREPALSVPIANRPGISLAWLDGFQLHAQLPIKADGSVIGYLTTEQRLPELDHLADELRRTGNIETLGFCADAGADLVCFPQRGGVAPYHIARADGGESGTLAGTDARGGRMLSVHAPQGATGISMNATMDVAEAYVLIRKQFLHALPLMAFLVTAGILLMKMRLRPMMQSLVRANQRAERSEARFTMAVESVYETFTTLECVRDDAGEIIDFRFTFCSDGFTARNGTSRRGMVGHCLSELFPDYRASGIFDRYRRVVETGEFFVREIEVSDPTALEKWLDMKVVRHGDGVAVTTCDISERKLFDHVVRDSETRFRLLAENAGDMIFRLDLDGVCLYASPAARAILGVDSEDLIGERLTASIDAEDAPRFDATLHALASAAIDEATVTHRALRSDGRCLWVEGKLRLLRDAANGTPLEIQGALRDISERRAAEEALRANEARLAAATESIHDSFTVFEAVRDAAGAVVDFRYAFINAAGAQALGRSVEELRGQLLCQLAPRTRANGFFDRCKHVVETGEVSNGELRLDRVEDVWVDLKMVRVGERGEIAVTYRDISERKRSEFLLQESEARMRQMAHHDGLTHLPNRTLFFDRLNEGMARAYRNEQPLVVMFIDIDHFKKFNDTHGHAGGDEVLKVVARRLSAAVRASDTVARFAGDEFTVILESVRSIDDVRLIGEKLLEAMCAPIQLGVSQVQVTLSIGAAFLESGTADVDLMMSTADSALYEVKQNGRAGFRAITLGARADGVTRDDPLPSEWFEQLDPVDAARH